MGAIIIIIIISSKKEGSNLNKGWFHQLCWNFILKGLSLIILREIIHFGRILINIYLVYPRLVTQNNHETILYLESLSNYIKSGVVGQCPNSAVRYSYTIFGQFKLVLFNQRVRQSINHINHNPFVREGGIMACTIIQNSWPSLINFVLA